MVHRQEKIPKASVVLIPNSGELLLTFTGSTIVPLVRYSTTMNQLLQSAMSGVIAWQTVGHKVMAVTPNFNKETQLFDTVIGKADTEVFPPAMLEHGGDTIARAFGGTWFVHAGDSICLAVRLT